MACKMSGNLEAVLRVVQQQTQALKDIMNAAGNCEPYTASQLESQFGDDYAAGVTVLESAGWQELA